MRNQTRCKQNTQSHTTHHPHSLAPDKIVQQIYRVFNELLWEIVAFWIGSVCLPIVLVYINLRALLGEYRCFCFQYNVNINIGKHCTLSLCCFYSINPLIPTITCNHHTFQKALKWSDEMKTKIKCRILQMENDAAALSANVYISFFWFHK